AGATEVMAIAASPRAPIRFAPSGKWTLLQVAERTVYDLFLDEIIRNDGSPPLGWGDRKVTVITPTIETHDTMTIDPGLVSIAMHYGFMRAFDEVGITDADARVEFRRLSDEITLQRLRRWKSDSLVAN